MKIFFAGIIQGSRQGRTVHAQEYRVRLKQIIRGSNSDIEIFDPVDGHETSAHYDDVLARQVFFNHLEIVGGCDLLIAFLPEASMGTAIEMQEAYARKIPIITISPMTTNWVIRLLSVRNFETIGDFEKFVSENDIHKIVSEFKQKVEERV